MIELAFVEDKNSVTELFQRIFGEDRLFPEGMIVALEEKGEKIGLAVTNLYEDGVILKLIGILPELRKKNIGDFFTRALFYKFTLSGNPFYIDYYDEFYTKFGFSKFDDNKMKAEKIIYPTSCGGH